ncbi:Type 1 glutamine amidotransferase-like domain-containing protein [Nocardia camponoti]|uniref:Peptidase n=1 Tax=Nocardia camponoti TaxID=1616106 RepID=A0A917VAR3_9NOCA|nr:Type 1 glutamine amidotransferase-like domain-containing protein [Nocardia camponoti]GGK56188.1 hypothetical protein GCM10011591_30250 [Nocardia camponoti]
MRLFLASYQFGAFADRLASLVAGPGAVAVIPNAMDGWPDWRTAAVATDTRLLDQHGYSPSVVDLRDFVDDAAGLEARLREFPLVWVRGGNTFVLRAQFARSGADSVLPRLLREDALAYAGYSAGACVLSPDLHGIELADDPNEVFPATRREPQWDGLGLIDRPMVVHLDSPTDPDGACGRMRDRLVAEGVEHYALTDADVLVVDGERTELLRG